jgi:hypothetical protein
VALAPGMGSPAVVRGAPGGRIDGRGHHGHRRQERQPRAQAADPDHGCGGPLAPRARRRHGERRHPRPRADRRLPLGPGGFLVRLRRLLPRRHRFHRRDRPQRRPEGPPAFDPAGHAAGGRDRRRRLPPRPGPAVDLRSHHDRRPGPARRRRLDRGGRAGGLADLPGHVGRHPLLGFRERARRTAGAAGPGRPRGGAAIPPTARKSTCPGSSRWPARSGPWP